MTSRSGAGREGEVIQFAAPEPDGFPELVAMQDPAHVDHLLMLGIPKEIILGVRVLVGMAPVIMHPSGFFDFAEDANFQASYQPARLLKLRA